MNKIIDDNIKFKTFKNYLITFTSNLSFLMKFYTYFAYTYYNLVNYCFLLIIFVEKNNL